MEESVCCSKRGSGGNLRQTLFLCFFGNFRGVRGGSFFQIYINMTFGGQADDVVEQRCAKMCMSGQEC